MRLTTIFKGQHFGEICTDVRGIVTYRLSPYEQKAFANLSETIPNTIQRMVRGGLWWIPSK